MLIPTPVRASVAGFLSQLFCSKRRDMREMQKDGKKVTIML